MKSINQCGQSEINIGQLARRVADGRRQRCKVRMWAHGEEQTAGSWISLRIERVPKAWKVRAHRKARRNRCVRPEAPSFFDKRLNAM